MNPSVNHGLFIDLPLIPKQRDAITCFSNKLTNSVLLRSSNKGDIKQNRLYFTKSSILESIVNLIDRFNRISEKITVI